MKKLLVTGAFGFIGRACLKELNNSGYDLYVLSRHPTKTWVDLKFIQCDITNTSDVTHHLAKIRPNYLIHLAWFTEHQAFWTSQKNIPYIEATRHLYEQFSLQGGEKAILLGSCAEYDPKESNCNEFKTPLQPNTLYGHSKKETYELIKQLKNDNPHYAAYCWIRLFNIFGPHENPNRLIPMIFNSFLKNQTPHLINPHLIRDHIDVSQLAKMIATLLKNNHEGPLNVGQGKEISIADLTLMIRDRYFKHMALPNYSTDNLDCNRFVPDLNQLSKLNIPLTISFEQALDNTYQWWKNLCH